MKWERAVHHLDELARKCVGMADAPRSIHPLGVIELWAVGAILEEPRDLDVVTVALVVDLPVDEVPWLTEPAGAQHWAAASRLARGPFEALWRPAGVPVWNHRIVRPALLWSAADGVAESTLAALREGRGEQVRVAQEGGRYDRVPEETAVSLRALRERTREYGERRWAPGKLDPLADRLHQAARGYLDLVDAGAVGRA